jgi:trimethylamine---corrinoid protein Co-methyltransferase
LRSHLQVLSNEERERVHEQTLALLEKKGMRVDTDEGRRLLAEAGALVDDTTRMVRFPRSFVEEMLSRPTKRFSLGGRRPGFELPLNAGQTTLLVDGSTGQILDHRTGVRRDATMDDVDESLRLIDAIDDIGLSWDMLEPPLDQSTPSGVVTMWRHHVGSFSKHVQDSFGDPALAPWKLEALEAVHGGRDGVRAAHPYSFLITPTSPLVIEEHYTDTWLAMRGYDIPVAVMPMALMGATAPGSMIATVVQLNAEVIGTLCLIQAAEPGTPFIYAPVFAAMDPRSGRLAGGGIEHAVMAAAGVELARSYGLPVLASGAGTHTYTPGVQTGYEKASTALMSMLAQPDIFVGPGSLGGATFFSYEQLIVDVEILRICAKAQRGMATDDALWLADVLEQVEPAGDFLKQPSTRKNARGGEWYISDLDMHDSYETWDAAGRPDVMDNARAKVDRLLAEHQPLALDDDVVRELEKLQERADAAS